MKVIIDNGHGVKTQGKCSPLWPDGSILYEYEFNRDIAKRLANTLDYFGIDNVIIVPEIEDISLAERVKRINEYHEEHPDSFLVSIHANAASVRSANGWEIFTSKGETKSDALAEQFVKSAKNNLRGFKIRKDLLDGDSDKEANFYILKNTRCPAVLTENLFMTNQRDCEFLMSEKGRRAITKLHFDAIMRIIKSQTL